MLILTADVGPQRHLTVVDHGLPTRSSESSTEAAAVHLGAAKATLTKRLRNKHEGRDILVCYNFI